MLKVELNQSTEPTAYTWERIKYEKGIFHRKGKNPKYDGIFVVTNTAEIFILDEGGGTSIVTNEMWAKEQFVKYTGKIILSN